MTRNEAGGFIFQNVGELNPRIAFESNNIQYCGVGVLNNTAIGVVDFYVQNTKLLTIANNYLGYNAGGINVNTTTKDNEVSCITLFDIVSAKLLCFLLVCLSILLLFVTFFDTCKCTSLNHIIA